MNFNAPPQLSSSTSLRTLGRLLTNQGHYQKNTLNVFDAVNDQEVSQLNTALTWLFSPLLGLSVLTKTVYEFVDANAKQDDAVVVINEILFNQKDKEVVTVGQFEISTNEENHVVVTDTGSVTRESINTRRTKAEIVKDFENSINGAINSSTKTPPREIIELHERLKAQEKIKNKCTQHPQQNTTSSSQRPIPPQPIITNSPITEKPFVGTIPDRLHNVFRCIVIVGLDRVRTLCDFFLNGRFDIITEFRFSVDGQDRDYRDTWLGDATEEDIRQIKNILQELEKKSSDILAPLKINADTSQQITIVSPGHFGLSDAYQLVAKAGFVYIQKTDGSGEASNLMHRDELIQCYQVNLSGLDLTRVRLRGNFNGRNFSRSKLKHTEPEGDFQNANLSDVDNINLKHLDYFTESKLDLRRANLAGTRLYAVPLLKVKIDEYTILEDTSIQLKLPQRWTDYELDSSLNHLHNRNSGSLLTKIECINNTYSALKINLVHQIIDSLGDTDVSSVATAMLDILSNNPIYLNDEKIKVFIRERIFGPVVKTANTSALIITNAAELRLFLEITETAETKAKFMLENNGFFVQLLALALTHQDQHIKERAVQLYHAYMNLDELKGYKNSDTYIGNNEETSPGAVEENLKEIRGIEPIDRAFVFFQKDSSGVTHALIVSQEMITRMLKPDPNYPWDDVLYNRNNAKTIIKSAEEAYTPFHLFHRSYQFQQNRATFPKLLDTIDLNFKNPKGNKNTLARDYTALFQEALDLTCSPVKLTGTADQIALGEIFMPLLKIANGDVIEGISDTHFQQLSKIYDFSKLNDTKKAQTLMCLAAMFVTYSSAYFFGDEGNSPEAIRKYALGLLTTAYKLDADVFKDTKGADQFGIWKHKLLGTGDAFTCTAVLKTQIKNHVRQKGFDDVMGRIKPPSW